jgi:hypothetical protein
MASPQPLRGMPHHETTLGVAPGATAKELRRAYLKLVLKWHPDKAKPEQKEEAEAKFKEVSAAYVALTKELDIIIESEDFEKLFQEISKELDPQNAFHARHAERMRRYLEDATAADKKRNAAKDKGRNDPHLRLKKSIEYNLFHPDPQMVGVKRAEPPCAAICAAAICAKKGRRDDGSKAAGGAAIVEY